MTRTAGHVGAALALALAASTSVLAFNTKFHFDLIREATRRDLSPDAIQVVQVSSWLCDFHTYASIPFTKLEARCLELHFDNLPDWEAVNTAWETARDRFVAASARDDLTDEKALLLLGIGLHLVQDFYAHSTWTDFGDEAVKNGERDLLPWRREDMARLRGRETLVRGARLGLETGRFVYRKVPSELLVPEAMRRGDLCRFDHDVVHKDHPGGPGEDVLRARHERAYAFAVRAGREWCELFLRTTKRRGLARFALSETWRAALHSDQLNARRISLALGSWTTPQVKEGEAAVAADWLALLDESVVHRAWTEALALYFEAHDGAARRD